MALDALGSTRPLTIGTRSAKGAPVPEEGAADILTGIVYASGDCMLCEVAWIDPPPGLNEIKLIMDQAADALEDG